MKNKGYTIFELLVVIALSLIVGAAFYTFYNTVIKENISKSTIAKQEQDAFILANQVVKDLSTIGFGVDSDRLKINDGTACDLDPNNNPFLTFCYEQKQYAYLAYLSLAGPEGQYAGCWGFIDRTGTLNTYYIVNDNKDNVNKPFYLSYSYLNKQCPPYAGNYIRLNTLKELKETFTYDPNNPDPSKRNSYAFYVGNNRYPDDFKVIFSLDNKNLPKECAPGKIFNLQKTIGTSSSPVISCVLDFQVKYVGTDGSIDDKIKDINKLSAIKLCMIVQVGRKQSVPDNPPNYSQAGGCVQYNYYNDANYNEWRYYRWAVIEQVIPLMNIR
ncbi:prepilin-type N-terminal cleavage/methylation domain-containing protein [Sulfurihydrogenibium sp.]|jgi:type IV pilus assembly protein PilW|uniref:PilW family protein n=1 Tax=Sulfurihydrogenibium sp. TaxID=2053621 RepID=UPI0026122BD4|nr:prepilin-type N-terminal cleavage/methylation domain-containing protein [Sulfurihydrogenibium sp.]